MRVHGRRQQRYGARLRAPLSIGGSLLLVAVLLPLVTLASVVVPVATAPPAAAVPGNPGVMEAPSNFYYETFENVTWDESLNWTSTASYVQTLTEYPYGAAPGSPGYQPGYTGASGVTYTGDPQWSAGTNCNGLVLKAQTTPPGAFTPTAAQDAYLPTPGPAEGCRSTGGGFGAGHWFNASRLLAQLMGRYQIAPTYAYDSVRGQLACRPTSCRTT